MKTVIELLKENKMFVFFGMCAIGGIIYGGVKIILVFT